MTEQEIIYQYIEMTPFRGHEPIFRGTTIRVKHIVDDLAKGMSIDEILSEHKPLNKDHIQACFVYIKHALEEAEDLRIYAATGIRPFWKYLFSSNK